MATILFQSPLESEHSRGLTASSRFPGGGGGGPKQYRLLFANVERFCLLPPPPVWSSKSLLGQKPTRQFCSEVVTYFYQRWNAELQLFIMPPHGNQDSCSEHSGILLSPPTLGFLAYPFLRPKIGCRAAPVPKNGGEKTSGNSTCLYQCVF